jgi:hypothetical protein
MRRGIATAAALAFLLLAPSANATYEQVGHFAGSPTLQTKEQIEANEEVQLGGVGGMAVNYTGAGGVPAGTVYAATRVSPNPARVVMFTPGAPPASELTFSLSWEITTSGGPYGRCGPALGSTCPLQVGASPGSVDVDIDPTTGNVYVIEGATTQAGKKFISVYTPDGSAEITRFGERIAEGSKTAESPDKIHNFPSSGAIAVNGAGEVYVFDVNNFDGFYHRLMKFVPKVPGKYDAYEYAGAAEDIGAGFGVAGQPAKPVLDAAGNIYVSSQELSIEMYVPTASPGDPPTCSFTFAKEGIAGITVDPKSATPFFYSYKKETGFALRTVRQLAPCDPASGKFKDPVSGKEVIDLINVSPERDYLWGLAFDPERKLAGRPAGVLYGAAPSPVPNVGTGQSGQSSLGYVFAQSAVPQKALTVAKTGSGTGKVTSSPSGIDCGTICTAEFGEGEAVTLTAKADAGSEFKGWSGSGCSGTSTCEVTMSEARAVTAEFNAAAKPKFALKVKKSGLGTGTVTSSPPGINCGLTCEAEYEEGTAVTLTGAPGANTKSATWTGCDSVNGENKCLVSMSGAKEVTATFALEQHLLSVSKTGSGTGKVTSSAPGIDCGATCSASFDHGTVVTLSAPADAGSEFSGWSGGCAGAGTCEVTMSEAKEVTATFEEEEIEEPGIPLTVSLEGTGGGTVTSDSGLISCTPFCSDEYEAGTVVTLTATPAQGSTFYSWKYCDAGGVNGRQCTVTLDKAKTVKATFTTTHALTLTKAGGLGKVQSSPGGILCLANCSETTAAFREGTEVVLKQTPAKHFHFVEWLGDCSGASTCQVTMGEDHDVSAEFAEDPKHLLTLTKSGGGAGTVKSSVAGINCGATCATTKAAYYQGEIVELTATPGKGSAFKGWSGAGCSGTGTCSVTISEAKEVTAEFG